MKARSEQPAIYAVKPDQRDGDTIIAQAIAILASRMRAPGDAMSSPKAVKDFLRLNLAQAQHEIFAALWIDGQNRLIAYEELFRGTLTQTSVYPREVVKSALTHNAGACILAHNHPSGFAEPSLADEVITSTIKQALALVDCKVLDHMIVGGASVMSFAERGLI
jgi:DNA repair protein RadC